MVCRHFRTACAAGWRPGPAHSPLRSRSKGGSRARLALPRERASVMRQFGDEQAKRKGRRCSTTMIFVMMGPDLVRHPGQIGYIRDAGRDLNPAQRFRPGVYQLHRHLRGPCTHGVPRHVASPFPPPHPRPGYPRSLLYEHGRLPGMHRTRHALIRRPPHTLAFKLPPDRRGHGFGMWWRPCAVLRFSVLPPKSQPHEN